MKTNLENLKCATTLKFYKQIYFRIYTQQSIKEYYYISNTYDNPLSKNFSVM